MDTMYQAIFLPLIHMPAQSMKWTYAEGVSNEGQKLSFTKPIYEICKASSSQCYYDPRELGHYLSNFLQNVSHPQAYKHCSKPSVAAQLLHDIDPS